MAIKLTNNARSTLAAALSTSATTLTIVSGNAGLFPSLGTGDWFPLTIVAPSGEYEIVRATARSGANITIVRAQEGTTSRAFDIGAKVDLRITAAVVAAFFDRSSHIGAQAIDTVSELPEALGSLNEADVGLSAALEALATEVATKGRQKTPRRKKTAQCQRPTKNV